MAAVGADRERSAVAGARTKRGWAAGRVVDVIVGLGWAGEKVRGRQRDRHRGNVPPVLAEGSAQRCTGRGRGTVDLERSLLPRIEVAHTVLAEGVHGMSAL